MALYNKLVIIEIKFSTNPLILLIPETIFDTFTSFHLRVHTQKNRIMYFIFPVALRVIVILFKPLRNKFNP